MAKAKVVHSEQACTIIFKGNPSSPEPVHGIIKFPGGHVEVTRCSDNKTYWAHLHIDKNAERLDSRVEYDYEKYLEHGIPEIPDQEHIKHMAIHVKGEYLDT